MELIDLRRLSPRELRPLFEEEEIYWREELLWDYRPSLDLLRRYLDAHLLSGYAVRASERIVGYGFYVLQGHKAVIGDVFVSRRHPSTPAAELLLAEMVATLRGIPYLHRIETQLITADEGLMTPMATLGFRIYLRQLRMLDLQRVALPPAGAAGIRLHPWRETWLFPVARLIRLAYENHVDSELNDQYRTESDILRFLQNIIYAQGCGQFLPEASFVVSAGLIEPALGVVLTSAVAPAVGHTTQLCVLPGYQGHGLGRTLMQASIAALQQKAFRWLTLTVTAGNQTALGLYERLGFRLRHTFPAGVWTSEQDAAPAASLPVVPSDPQDV